MTINTTTVLQLPIAAGLDPDQTWLLVVQYDGSSWVARRATAEDVANTGSFVPATRAINTGYGLSGGGTLASDLTLVWEPDEVSAKAAMVAADSFLIINSEAADAPYQTTFPNAMKAISGLTELAFPNLTEDFLVINRAADGNSYKVSPSSLSLATGNMPAGGTTGQQLVKASNADYDTEWTTGGFLDQLPNVIFAGPASGAAASPSFRALVAADLPNPQASAKGGVYSYTAVSNQFLTSIGTDGSVVSAQPSASNLSNGVTGSGAVVLATSPTLVTPVLGTPTSGTLTNCTGLPVSTGVSGLGAGVATFLATPSSANLAAAVTDETGSGSLVFATSPTLVTPTLGVATATSINKLAITAPATAATLTVADGKTLTASNTLTLSGTDASSVAFGAGGTVAYQGGTLAQFASTTSAQLAGVISDETGSGSLVFATSPVLVTPVLGTPTSGTLTNCTGLPVATGISGLGTGVATFLATPSSANLASAVSDETGSGSLVFATSPTLVTPVLGTPASGTLTNCTGLPVASGISGLGAGVATFLATPSSANLAAAVTDETGSGSLVFATSPTLTTPDIGAATGSSVTLSNGGALRTATGIGHTALLQAYDVDGALYTTFATLTAGNTPSMTLSNVTSSTAWSPTASDTAALGSTLLQWSDAFLASGAVLNFDNGNYTVTHSSGTLTFSGAISVTGGTATLGTVSGVIDMGAATSLEIPNSATPTVDADGKIGIDTSVPDFAQGLLKYYATAEMGVVAMPIAQFASPLDGATPTYNAANDRFELTVGGGGGGANTSLSNLAGVSINTSLISDTDVTDDLGTNAIRWNGVYAASLNTGDTAADTLTLRAYDVDGASYTTFATLTAANTPTMTLSNVTSSTTWSPTANDGGALGTATLSWSDLFLASGGVINIANGDWVATHTTGVLTVGTGDLRVTTAGTNSSSVVTVGGAQTLSNKTLTTPNIGTPSAGTLTNCTGLPLSSGVTGQLPLANGGTGANLVDPNADRILFWDDSAGASTWLTIGDGLVISGTTLANRRVGEIIAWPTSTAPSGTLQCDGSAVSRTTYADLFAVISDDYGAGDGSTTFNLPDYRGEFLRGWADGSTNDPDRASRTNRGDGVTGDNVGTKQSFALQNMTGTVSGGQETLSGTGVFLNGSAGANQRPSNGTSSTRAVDFDASNVAQTSTETRPRNVYVQFCIVY